MPASLLWVNKNAQSSSLSRSTTGKDEAAIRRHVQKQRPEGTVLATVTHVDRSKDTKFWSRDAATQQALQHAIPTSLGWTVGLALSSHERRSFHFFMHRTARSWAGWQDEFFWNDTALRLCHFSPAVLHSLIALASFHESMSSTGNSTVVSSMAALGRFQIEKAISAAARGSELTHLEALASCLGILCVQHIQQGRNEFKLLRSAARMLEDTERPTVRRHISKPDLDLIDLHIRPLYDRMWSGLCMMTDPVYALQTSIRRRAVETYTSGVKAPDIPTSFDGLLEARECLEQLLQWAHDAHATVPCDEATVKGIQAACQSWLVALNATRSSLQTEQDLARSYLLQAACIHGKILLESVNFKVEKEFDSHIDAWRTILQAVQNALNLSGILRTGLQVSFGIDDGLVDILAFVSMRCRDPVLRRRAIDLMLHGGRKEGGRLVVTAGVIGQIIMLKEESGLDNVCSASDIPDEHRWKLVKGGQYFAMRKICLTFAKSGDGLNGGNFCEEQTWIDLPNEMGVLDDALTVQRPCDELLPDVIFGRGFVSFRENRKTDRYHRIGDHPFHFPIPRA